MTFSIPVANAIIDEEIDYAESVVSWNVKMLLLSQNKTQIALANAFEVQKSTISNKLNGRIAWSLSDIIRAARFLDTTPENLMDDGLMKQMQELGNKNTAVADVRPRYFIGAPSGIRTPDTLIKSQLL